jgi:hypothetical protein
MQVRAIFVHPDGARAERLLKDAPPVYHEPTFRIPAIWEPESNASVVTTQKLTYRRSTCRMFDGRRVYCAPGCEVREAYLSKAYALSEDRERVKATMEGEVHRFVQQTYRAAIQLDRIDFDFPWHDRQRNLGRLEVRLLVVISDGDLPSLNDPRRI